jgi:putative membrane-bound dehydrogenase-like protein
MTKHAWVVGLIAGIGAAMPAPGQVNPDQTVESFKVAAGLEVSVWAHEPGVVKPTNMDIDERGRIWVAEGANYRGSKTRPEGDRIVILEDTKHTGQCDSYKVFVQDKRLLSPLGVCKLGNKLYVAQSPDVFVYTIDESGDKPVGDPEILFTGFGGVNHDHGVHAGIFGADGQYYFNCGNEGDHGDVIKHDGRPVVDITGSEVGNHAKMWRGKEKPKGMPGYREGLAMSCNLDGSELKVIGYNFRNNYELCVDSFGTVWQSDNDDDGNQGVRINYVMEGGNFGYTGPRGSSWGRDRNVFPGQTLQEAHWHQRWPGVVPNMLHTGGGSPTGICIYEGDLLPEQFRGALIHADAGPNVIRAYLTQPSEHVARGLMNSDGDESSLDKPGAGYKCEPVELVKAQDHWFRPSDVCVGPDGAVYIADWYDPGVGGHQTGDTGVRTHDWHKLHGRIYRLAPTGFKPSAPKLDLNSVPGQMAALMSPNLATRYLGYTKLAQGGEPALKALQQVYQTSQNPRFRARAMWLLARGPQGAQVVQSALKDKDANIRIAAIRADRLIKQDMVKVANKMMGDSSPGVLRELCLAMNYEPDDGAIPVLVKLADKFDGTDRWYLEALGIGATGREQELLDAWKSDHQNNEAKVAQGIEWRLKMQPVPMDQAAGARPTGEQFASTARALPDLTDAQKVMTKDGQVLPPADQLASLKGDPAAGEKVFRNAAGANCIKCHQLGNEGGIVGPPLTVIGQKLNKSQIYDSIFLPSAAIEMSYETWVVKCKSGEVLTGRKVEDTDDHLTILDADGKYHDVAADDVQKKVKQNISLMPEGLTSAMSKQDLVDLVEFLSSRK